MYVFERFNYGKTKMKLLILFVILLRFLACVTTLPKGEAVPDYIDDVENVKNYAWLYLIIRLFGRLKMENSGILYAELLEELLHKLEEAVDSGDWELVKEVIYTIRENLENPFDEYGDEEWG